MGNNLPRKRHVPAQLDRDKWTVSDRLIDEVPCLPEPVRHILVSPRTWLSLGIFCIGVSFVLGYHLDQQSADRVLAQKVGRPGEVLVQEFIPDLRKNMINGVHLLGQTSDQHSITVDIGTESDPRRITVRPIYAVGPDLLPMARQHIRETHGMRARPIPRSAADDLRRIRMDLSGISGMALAFVIDEVRETPSPESPGPSPLSVVEEVHGAQLVEIVGAEVTGSSLRDIVSDALLRNGMPSVPDSLLVASARMANPTSVNDSGVAALRWWLLFIGAVLAVMALAAPHLSGWLGKRAARPAKVSKVEAQGAFPAVSAFQPIASQDELASDEERDHRENSRSTHIRRRMSRLTEFAASTFGGVRSPR